jgi:hypothetical protein
LALDKVKPTLNSQVPQGKTPSNDNTSQTAPGAD